MFVEAINRDTFSFDGREYPWPCCPRCSARAVMVEDLARPVIQSPLSRQTQIRRQPADLWAACPDGHRWPVLLGSVR